MKRMILVLFCAVILLAGCGSSGNAAGYAVIPLAIP